MQILNEKRRTDLSIQTLRFFGKIANLVQTNTEAIKNPIDDISNELKLN